jgi:hypothetical protein
LEDGDKAGCFSQQALRWGRKLYAPLLKCSESKNVQGFVFGNPHSGANPTTSEFTTTTPALYVVG